MLTGYGASDRFTRVDFQVEHVGDKGPVAGILGGQFQEEDVLVLVPGGGGEGGQRSQLIFRGRAQGSSRSNSSSSASRQGAKGEEFISFQGDGFRDRGRGKGWISHHSYGI